MSISYSIGEYSPTLYKVLKVEEPGDIYTVLFTAKTAAECWDWTLSNGITATYTVDLIGLNTAHENPTVPFDFECLPPAPPGVVVPVMDHAAFKHIFCEQAGSLLFTLTLSPTVDYNHLNDNFQGLGSALQVCCQTKNTEYKIAGNSTATVTVPMNGNLSSPPFYGSGTKCGNRNCSSTYPGLTANLNFAYTGGSESTFTQIVTGHTISGAGSPPPPSCPSLGLGTTSYNQNLFDVGSGDITGNVSFTFLRQFHESGVRLAFLASFQGHNTGFGGTATIYCFTPLVSGDSHAFYGLPAQPADTSLITYTAISGAGPNLWGIATQLYGWTANPVHASTATSTSSCGTNTVSDLGIETYALSIDISYTP